MSLPFKIASDNSSDSLSLATKRFHSLGKRLDMYPTLKPKYSAVIQDYLTQEHLRFVGKLGDFSDCHNSYFIPHHAVFKKDSKTTPIRVVFDASLKIFLQNFH